ncbi:hypothetical protein OESDEN_22157 [Oesophagostomum dentatum]|uniref:Mos1 transposase HTH domain-containing protein n=1 Tax=Oesophagostomum dentatum TaxID=61180 RepID=A0A0B1RYS3_OESDE|nr:hypothetical protein OESDEN_22157 [Oesophagostomum dentatum]
MCKVHGVNVLSQMICKNWFTKFRSGNFSLQDGQRSGRTAEKDQKFYERGITKLPERWQKIIEQNGASTNVLSL